MEGDKTKESQHDASLQRMRMFLKRKENEDRLMQLQSKQQSRTNSERFTAKEQVTRQPRTSCSEKGDISSMETCTQDKLEGIWHTVYTRTFTYTYFTSAKASISNHT